MLPCQERKIISDSVTIIRLKMQFTSISLVKKSDVKAESCKIEQGFSSVPVRKMPTVAILSIMSSLNDTLNKNFNPCYKHVVNTCLKNYVNL